MLDRNNLVTLMKTVAKADPSSPVAYSYNGQNLSYEALNNTLRNEMNELAGTNALYRENKNLIFSMIEETLDEVLPKKVAQSYEQFAEVKQFNKRRKKLYDNEYITYVCEKFNLNPIEIVKGWKKEFGSYYNFKKWIKS